MKARMQPNHRRHLIAALLLTFLMSILISVPAFADSTKGIARPTNLKAAGVNYQSIKFTWTPASSVSGYHLYAGTTANGAYKKVAVIQGGNVKSITLKGIIPGRKYYFKMQAYKGSQKSAFSNVITAKSKETVPAIRSIKIGVTVNTLHWNAIANVNSYHVFRAEGNGAFKDIKTLSPKTTSFADTHLKSDTKYRYYIQAVYKIKDQYFKGTRSPIRTVHTKIPDYKALYKKFLTKHQNSKLGYTSGGTTHVGLAQHFYLLPLNNDKIPELVISVYNSGKYDQCAVFTIKNNKVVFCGATNIAGFNRKLSYNTAQKSLATTGTLNGGRWNSLSQLMSDKLVVHKKAYKMANGTRQISYAHNSKLANVTKAAYDNFMNTYFKGLQQYTMYVNNASNRNAVLKK